MGGEKRYESIVKKKTKKTFVCVDQISGIFVVDFYVTVFRLIIFICERHRNFNSSLAEDSTCKAVANLTRIKANRS